ncbi:MAG: hypothetical protein KJO06_06195 [Gemmatimonadetes bacterium]|nr:hypothetical protein [Gemmatimonadota bacterium]
MKPATNVGVFLFALIAFGHLLRLLFGWGVVIGDKATPMWPSVLVVIVFGALSVAIWREAN